MVKSKLHSKIEYPENIRMDSEDKDHKSVIYTCNILNDNVIYRITLGKERVSFSHFNIFYYPLYLVNKNNKINGKIGFYEVEGIKRHKIKDDDDDVVIDLLGPPVLFPHVTSEFLRKKGNIVSDDDDNDDEIPHNKNEDNLVITSEVTVQDEDIQPKPSNNIGEDGKNENEDEDDDEDEDEDEDDNHHLSLNSPKKTKTTNKSIASEETITKDNIFTKVDLLTDTISYPEETKEYARSITKKYEPKTSDSWIIKSMENPNYKIKNISGDGNCFFSSIKQAYESIGFQTSVIKLRKAISQDVKLSQIEVYKDIYIEFEKEKVNIESKQDNVKLEYAELKQSKSSPSLSIENAKKLVSLSKDNKETMEKLNVEKEINENNLSEFAFMKAIIYDTTGKDKDQTHMVDRFKQYVESSDFWADGWAISSLELFLDMKVIIFQQSTDNNEILRCTIRDAPDEKYNLYVPKHYIILNYTGNNHYELISYKGKHIFNFSEIPYDVKIKVVRKCMEKSAGPFYFIKEFKQFRYDVGILDKDSDEDVDESQMTIDEKKQLHDELPIIQFYGHSASALPGKGRNDSNKSSTDNEPYFADLIKFLKGSTANEKEERKNWRKMLHDSWSTYKFEVDGKIWASVSHYILALQFKDKYMDVYHNFSLSDTTSTISSDLDKAEASLKKTKGKEGIHYKSKKATNELDSDLLKEYRLDALRSKFTQNADLTTILANTKLAKLQLYVPKGEPKEDYELMKVRKEILDAM